MRKFVLTVGFVSLIWACDTGKGPTIPTNNEPLSIEPGQGITNVQTITPTGEASPPAGGSYMTFGAGCSGKFCAAAGANRRLSIIATIPMRNDAASIYGEWFVEAEGGKCVSFGTADSFITFPGCGELPVQCDASFGYRGGAHAGHILTKVRATGECPRPTPTPTPPICQCVYGEWRIERYGEWGECARGVKQRTIYWIREGHMVCPLGTNCVDPCPPERKQTIEEGECDPQGLCHVSNKGKKDGQVNLVLSPKRAGEGHEDHLDPLKFCPPDHLGVCSCEKAISDATACGVPAVGGFVCKIEGH